MVPKEDGFNLVRVTGNQRHIEPKCTFEEKKLFYVLVWIAPSCMVFIYITSWIILQISDWTAETIINAEDSETSLYTHQTYSQKRNQNDWNVTQQEVSPLNPEEYFTIHPKYTELGQTCITRRNYFGTHRENLPFIKVPLVSTNTYDLFIPKAKDFSWTALRESMLHRMVNWILPCVPSRWHHPSKKI